jgi:Na+-driven multidrug efflux pump
MHLGIDPQRGRRIVALAAPIIVAMVTQNLINIVDTIYIGKLAPTYSIPGQAALGFALPFYWSIGGFLAAISVGTQATTARRFGSDDIDGAGATLTNSLSVGLLSAAVFTVLGWLAVPAFFPMLTSNPSVVELGVPYTQIRILAIVPMVCTFAFKGFFDGLGQTRIHMYASLVMNTINIFLNYVFIFGFGPIPALHVTGAAVASAVSTGIGLLAMIGWSLRKKYRDEYGYYKPTNVDPSVMWRLVKLSAPSGAAEIFMMLGGLVFLVIVGLLDEQAVIGALQATEAYSDAFGESAARLQYRLTSVESWVGAALAGDWAPTLLHSRPPIYTTAAKLIIDLLTLSFVTCIGFGQATATLVSQQMGDQNFREAERYGWDSVKAGMYFFGAIGLIVAFFPEFFLEILSDDPLVIEAAAPGLQIAASLEAFIAAALVLVQAHFGAGNTKFVMLVEGVLHIICLVPLAYLLAVALDFGFLGLWSSFGAYVVALACILAWKFWEGGWKEIEV